MQIIKHPHDLRIGDFVTIYDRVRPWPTELEVSRSSVVLYQWRFLRGLPMQVLAISSPFVLCELRPPVLPYPLPIILETDRFQITRLDPTYAAAYATTN